MAHFPCSCEDTGGLDTLQLVKGCSSSSSTLRNDILVDTTNIRKMAADQGARKLNCMMYTSTAGTFIPFLHAFRKRRMAYSN